MSQHLPLIRRALFACACLLFVIGFASITATPAHADDPSLTFPTFQNASGTATAERTIDADKIEPFCGLSSPGGLCFDFENRPALTDTACVNNMAGPYPCDNVDLEAFVPLADMDSTQAASLWGWTDPASGREFALVGMDDGTAFVEITDAINPVFLGKLPTATGTSLWRELKTLGHYAFIVADSNGSHGIQVFDLNNLLTVANPPVTFTQSARYTGVGSVHNMVIDTESGYGFAVGSGTCSGGLHMVDLNDPLNPTSAGCYSAAGYVHDAQCLTYHGPDQDYQGRELCITSDVNQIHVVDVTNKAAPVTISSGTYPAASYIHQSWLTPDGGYMVLDDELEDAPVTYIWDMRDLDNPVMFDTYTHRTGAIDHNQYTKDGYVYQANYRAGMSVVDAAGIATGDLTEVGSFDMYPPDDEECFSTAWNVYPYFDSGVVIVSGIEQGLFVLRPTNLTPPTAIEMGALTANPASTIVPALFGIAGLALVGGIGAGLVKRARRQNVEQA